MFTVNKNPDKSDLRNFGWAMLIGFGVLGAVVWTAPWLNAWRTGEPSPPLAWSGSGTQVTAVCLWAVGLSLWAVSMLTRSPARVVYIVWMSAAMALGTVMSTVLLTVLFIGLLPVFSVVVRIGDPLRKRPSAKETYWEDYRPYEATMERMRRPF